MILPNNLLVLTRTPRRMFVDVTLTAFIQFVTTRRPPKHKKKIFNLICSAFYCCICRRFLVFVHWLFSAFNSQPWVMSIEFSLVFTPFIVTPCSLPNNRQTLVADQSTRKYSFKINVANISTFVTRVSR